MPQEELQKQELTQETVPEGEQAASSDTAQSSCPCCARTKERSPEEYRALMNRLSRIEGQIRGIRRMLESDAYCPDILTQVSAVNAALDGFSRELLSQHIRTCVKDDILAGKDETLDELMDTLRKFMK